MNSVNVHSTHQNDLYVYDRLTYFFVLIFWVFLLPAGASSSRGEKRLIFDNSTTKKKLTLSFCFSIALVLFFLLYIWYIENHQIEAPCAPTQPKPFNLDFSKAYLCIIAVIYSHEHLFSNDLHSSLNTATLSALELLEKFYAAKTIGEGPTVCQKLRSSDSHQTN